MKKVKLQQQKNGQFTITLPAAFAKGYGWLKGQEFFWLISKEGLLLASEENE